MSTGRKKVSSSSAPREFNITGSIVPEEHYYVDPAPTIKKLMELVEKRRYFIINRPRQFGKTTILNFLAQRLQATGKFVPALISFERFTQRADITEAEFYLKTAKRIVEEMAYIAPDAMNAEAATPAVADRDDFFDWLREICQSYSLVLLIDEVDAAPETVVVGFLASLREMYLERSRRRKPAPYAVALAGVHDLKNLKARYRNETQTIGSASPFNIAIDYELPGFSLKNIRQYYLQHTAATGQEFDDAVISRVYEVTNGHPWLVSVLAKLLVEKIVPNRKLRIRLGHVENAIQELLATPNPNFDSLLKNARNASLFPIVLDLLEAKPRRYGIQNATIRLGVEHGIFAAKDRQLILANLIYVQVLYQNFEKELETFDMSGLIADIRI